MKIIKLIITTLILALLSCSTQYAQGTEGKNGRIEGNFKFLPIPYVNYNRSIGFQIGALPLAQFNLSQRDTLSPSSIAGLFGMYSTNETYFLMSFAKLYLDNDNWRFTTAGGIGTVFFQFYLSDPLNVWIPYNTKMSIYYIEVQRNIYKKIYLGVSYIYLRFTTRTEINDIEITNDLNGLGFKLSADYRSNVYYPRNGYLFNLKYFTYPLFLGNNSASNKIEISYNNFFSTRKDVDVFVARAYLGLGLGDLDFNQQFVVGRGDDIRGYTQGEYRGNYLLTVQGEYRWNFDGTKFGLVGFLGIATLFKSINENHNGKILPGIGGGIRYIVSEETNMNVGLDLAVGKGDWGIYFKIGESFNN